VGRKEGAQTQGLVLDRRLRDLFGFLDRRPGRVPAAEDGEEDVLLAPHHALGLPRRASRVEHGVVVARSGTEVAGRAAVREECFVLGAAGDGRLDDRCHLGLVEGSLGAGVVEEVPQPGDYVEYVIGDQSIFVVRGTDRSLGAYYNACLHRGTKLASGAGSFAEGRIKCSYHGWCYDLSGCVTDVPDREEFPDLP